MNNYPEGIHYFGKGFTDSFRELYPRNLITRRHFYDELATSRSGFYQVGRYAGAFAGVSIYTAIAVAASEVFIRIR